MMGDEMNETYDKLIRIDATADGVGCASENTETYSDHYWRRVFAGQAMQGCKQNPAMYHWSPGKVAEVALEQADALLAELRKREADDA